MFWLLGIGTVLLVTDSVLFKLIGNISPLFFTLGFLCLLGGGMSALYSLLVFLTRIIKKQ